MTNKIESFADKLIEKIESVLSYLGQNGDKIWIWYAYGILGTSFISIFAIAYSLVGIGIVSTSSDPYFWSVLGSGIIFVPLLLKLFNVIVTLAMISRIKKKDPSGITLAAISMVLCLISGSWIVLAFGIYAFINKMFRASSKDWAPNWYRLMSDSIESALTNRN